MVSNARLKVKSPPRMRDFQEEDVQAGIGRIFNEKKKYRVKKCPICGHDSLCFFDPLSGVCLCARCAHGGKRIRNRLSADGFLYIYRRGQPVAAGEHLRIQRPRSTAPSTTSEATATAADSPRPLLLADIRLANHRRLADGFLPILARDLGLPVWVLIAFRVGLSMLRIDGQDRTATLWPEVDAANCIVSFCRRPMQKRKGEHPRVEGSQTATWAVNPKPSPGRERSPGHPANPGTPWPVPTAEAPEPSE
jgi:hypothetical protein